jgi:protein-disulfide isomerase
LLFVTKARIVDSSRLQIQYQITSASGSCKKIFVPELAVAATRTKISLSATVKRYLPFIIVGLVALLTVGSAAMLYRQKAIDSAAASKLHSASPVGSSNKAVHIRGERDAPITLEEFGDFQCPPCATISPHLDDTERDYRPRLRLVFRNFPLAIHAHSTEAAYAAEAAGLQGRFWEMHDLLYKEQTNWSTAANVPTLFNSYAQMLGLDVDRFKTDMQSPAVKKAVEADQRDGTARGVTSTPTVFLNGVLIPPSSLNKLGVRAAIDAAIKDIPKKETK